MNAILQAHRERVGRKIRAARLQAGLSHDRLGAAVGTSRQHLIKLEKGQHLVGEGLLERIADATGKSVEFFSSDDDEETDLVHALELVIRRLVRDELKVAA